MAACAGVRIERGCILGTMDLQEGGLLIGAAVTQEEVVDKLLELTAPDAAASTVAAAAASAAADATGSFIGGFSRLWGGTSSGTAAPSGDAKPVWLPLAKHLQRIAGNQVWPCKPMSP